MRMKDLEYVSNYITHVQTITNQLKHNGETLMYAKVIEKILQSLTDDFENVVCAIEESRNLEEMTINDLKGSIKAHEHRKKKKKHEVLEAVLQIKMTIKENKVIYAQYNKGIGQGHKGRGYGQSRDCVVETKMKRNDKGTSKTSMDEVAVMEEMVIQIFQMLNVTIVKYMDTMQRIVMPRKRVKENANLVKEDETKDEDIT